jgi:periplasmic protein TonB
MVHEGRGWAVAALGTAGLHQVALFVLTGLAGVEQVPPSAPPAEPPAQLVEAISEPAPPPPAAEPQSAPPTPKKPARAPREAPPAAAAQAGKIIAAPEESVDFGDNFISGEADTHVGGITASAGSARHAVYDAQARGSGIDRAQGDSLAGDLSRPPSVAGGASWDCPFPAEAEEASIDHATVSLRVEVAADGGVLAVRATADPGSGFGREARRCAQGKRWSAGLDRAGRPTRSFALVNVHFDR